MRYNTIINNVKSIEWGLNLQQSYLFAWLYELPSWADKVILGSDIFYFASKNKACEELPILTDKIDTMYRYYKQLEEKELILIKKIDGKDFISLTNKAKEWNFLNQSGIPEINPTPSGSISESKSEINPINNNINSNNKTIDQTNGLFEQESIPTLSKDVLRFLNEKKPSKIAFEATKSNLKDIESRIKENFKLDDFKKVIEFKIKEWGNDSKMKKYIRPETLFGSKFNSYLVEAHETKKDGSANFVQKQTTTSDLL